jgi:hypothetical protein
MLKIKKVGALEGTGFVPGQTALSLDRLRSIAAAIGAVASVECPTGCRAR